MLKKKIGLWNELKCLTPPTCLGFLCLLPRGWGGVGGTSVWDFTDFHFSELTFYPDYYTHLVFRDVPACIQLLCMNTGPTLPIYAWYTHPCPCPCILEPCTFACPHIRIHSERHRCTFARVCIRGDIHPCMLECRTCTPCIWTHACHKHTPSLMIRSTHKPYTGACTCAHRYIYICHMFLMFTRYIHLPVLPYNIHTHTHTHTFVCICPNPHICIYTCPLLCTPACNCTCSHKCERVCMRAIPQTNAKPCPCVLPSPLSLSLTLWSRRQPRV